MGGKEYQADKRGTSTNIRVLTRGNTKGLINMSQLEWGLQ